MAVEQTGTATILQSSAQSDSDTISVPSDAEVCVVGAVYYSSGFSADFSSLTLGGQAFSSIYLEDTLNISTLWRLTNPPTGSQTLAWQWSRPLSDGASIFVAFFKGVNTTSPIRSSGGASENGDPPLTASASISSAVGDLLVGVGCSNSTTDADMSGNGQTEIADSTEFNGVQGAMATKPGAAGSISMQCVGWSPSVAVCSLRAAPTTYSKTLSIDALIQQTLSTSITMDALLTKTLPVNVSVDALLAQLRAISVALDAHATKTDSRGADVDALIQKSASGSLQLDAQILGAYTKGLTIDALLQRLGISTSLSIDALVKKTGAISTSLDAILYSLTAGQVTTSIDALIQRAGVIAQADMDAMLYASSTATTVIDALLLKQLTASLAMDALIQMPGVPQGINIDAQITALQTVSASLDAILENASGLGVALDALLTQLNQIKTCSLDAMLMTGQVRVSSLDAIVFETLGRQVDFDALLTGPGQSSTLLDAIIYSALALATPKYSFVSTLERPQFISTLERPAFVYLA